MAFTQVTEVIPGVPDFESLSKSADFMDNIESSLMKMDQLVIEPIHHFSPGEYAREIFIPAGTILTGKIHKTDHRNRIPKGVILVWNASEGTRKIEAPFEFEAKAGSRRIGFTLTDTVWITIHKTDETDLDKLEEILIEPHGSKLIKNS